MSIFMKPHAIRDVSISYLYVVYESLLVEGLVSYLIHELACPNDRVDDGRSSPRHLQQR